MIYKLECSDGQVRYLRTLPGVDIDVEEEIKKWEDLHSNTSPDDPITGVKVLSYSIEEI